MPEPLIDYTELATEAQTLVAGTGRSVTFVQLDRDPADPSKPWRGASDPRATPESTVAGSAVFVEPSSATALGMSTEIVDSLVKRSEAIMIVALGPTVTADLQDYDEVIDGSKTWRIEGVEKLQPADVVLLYFVGVAGK